VVAPTVPSCLFECCLIRRVVGIPAVTSRPCTHCDFGVSDHPSQHHVVHDAGTRFHPHYAGWTLFGGLLAVLSICWHVG